MEAVRLYGSEKNLALKLNITQSTISKWIKDPKITIPYELALKIEQVTGISIERLIPNQPAINAYLKERTFTTLLLRKIATNKIITTNSVSLPFLQPNRFIIMGTDGILISGLQILNNHSEKTIPALILDLAAILSKELSLENIIHKLSISERVAIGLRLEQLIGNRQGQKNTKNNPINQQISGIYYQIIGRTDVFVANIIQLSKNTYIRAKQVYLSYNEHLINAVDNKIMPINKAREQLKLSILNK
jgi:plasmid maintenance system antidote protein VapI